MIDVFDYTDYREFLRDLITYKKNRNPVFSYRYIARNIGFKSAGHFSLILHGKVNLSTKYIGRFIDFFKLTPREGEYFKAMVLYNQSKAHEEKSTHFRNMVSFREFNGKMIEKDSYKIFEKWYYVAVREILSYYSFTDNYKELARIVMPPITSAEAKEAVDALLETGMIRRNSKGIMERVESIYSTGTKIPTVVLGNFLESTMDIAKDSLYNIEREKRMISWATVSVSQETFSEIKEELRAFRKKILKKAEADQNPD
ncbi:MAG: TIGR02147 family protein, partial [Chitinivibrionales bacterium]